jgi:serine/threonine-protein kinase
MGHIASVPKRRWQLDKRLDLFCRIARTVAELHERDVVHGSLCPHNVLLDDSLRPLVSEVGLIDVFDAFEGDVRNAHGYGAYAAPELRDGEGASEASDVFSLGRLLYFLLLGDDPSEPHDEVPRLNSILNRPAALVRIVRMATVRDPLNRYQSVDALLEDLDNHVSPEEVGLDHPEVEETNLAPIDWAPPPLARAAKKAPAPPTAEPPATRRVAVARKARVVDTPATRAAAEAAAAGAEQAPESPPRPRRPRRKPAAQPAPLSVTADPVTRRQQAFTGVGGSAALVVLMTIAFFSSWDGAAAYVCSLIAALAMSLFIPTFGYEFLKYRALVAMAFVAVVALIDPVGLSASLGRTMRMSSGDAKGRAAAVKQMRDSGEVELSDADLHDADLSGMDLNLVSFDRSNLRGAKLVGAQLANATVRGADVTGADFTGARLSDVDMSTATGFSEAICSEETVMPPKWTCIDGKPSR